MNIGDIKLKNNVLLAPMAGVTDLPFRLVCKEMGADIVYTEFVSANGIIRESKKTFDLIKFIDQERPIGVQIFGEDPSVVGLSAKMIYERCQPDLIDINFGCPVPKVTKKGAGSAALKDLSLMIEITSSVVENVPEIPVTIKMRSGWSENNLVFIEAGEKLEKTGIKAITLHPRTTSQRFEGSANWEHIKELKKNISIPVIGNGDVRTVQGYTNIMSSTMCDAVMIGRGALGNPWIFRDIVNRNNNKKQSIQEVPILEIAKVCEKHFNLLIEHKEERTCLNLTKKHFSWYLKGFKNASSWRKKILFSNSLNEVLAILNSMKGN